ncbi:MAG TPA: 50S ribosomal protein L25 [Candidatus Portnoybacteria bacterium]|nr:50S ribosomal protein L25 [Candidatus Portnoybacteria bacterium]
MLELETKIRKILGKKVKNLRKKDILPAILYGHKVKNISLEIDLGDFKKIYQQAGGSTLIKLKIKDESAESGKERNVLIYRVNRDPVTDEFIHVDFYQIRKGEKITAEVALIFEGESPAVKNEGGILVKDITALEIESLPENLPHQIKVDISKLEKFGDNIRIKDLAISGEIKVKVSPEEVVASVIPPRTKEEVAALEEEVEEKVEEVGKVEEEREEKVEEGEEKKEGEKEKQEEKEQNKEQGEKK